MDLYIRGNGLGLSWSKGRKMVKDGKDTWYLNITFSSGIDGYRCHGNTCEGNKKVLFPPRKMEYRIFLNDQKNMLGANFAVPLPISRASIEFHERPLFPCHPWFFNETGIFEESRVHSTQLGRDFITPIYLPPSFYENTYKKYSVIVGIDLAPRSRSSFMTYDSILSYTNDLFVKHAISEEFIQVGFGDYEMAKERPVLLAPSPGFMFECRNGSYRDGCRGCINKNNSMNWETVMKCSVQYKIDGKGDEVLDFIINRLLPSVGRFAITRNRALLHRENVGIIGYSLGGLLACHAAWTRPDVFGMAACMSSSFWWPLASGLNTCRFDFLNRTIRQNVHLNRPHQKVYLDVGGAERTMPIFQMVKATERVGQIFEDNDAFKINQNLWVNIFPGHIHSPYHYVIRAWEAYSNLLRPKGEPHMPTSANTGTSTVSHVSLTTILTCLFILIFQSY